MQEMANTFIGQEIPVAVLEASAATRKVVCSIVKAKENEGLRKLEVRRSAAEGRLPSLQISLLILSHHGVLHHAGWRLN